MLFYYGLVQDMLAQSRQEHSGIQLEVNERILDSCTSLMMVSCGFISYLVTLLLVSKTPEKYMKNTREGQLLEHVMVLCIIGNKGTHLEVEDSTERNRRTGPRYRIGDRILQETSQMDGRSNICSESCGLGC